ncbi:MAG: DPP IV N-terminal domain-containing protein [Marinifilaceae bacterium]
MKNLFTIILFTMWFIPQSYAQIQNANYKQAILFENEIEKFRNDLSLHPTFINNTDIFWYKYKTSEGTKFYIVDPNKRTRKELFDLVDVLGQISQITHKAYDHKSFYANNLIFAKDGKSFTFGLESNEYKYCMQTGKVTQQPKAPKCPYHSKPSGHILSPDSLYYIYAHKHNLYIYGNPHKNQDSTIVQLTHDGELHNSYARYPDEAPNEETAPRGRWLKNSKYFLAELEDDRKLDFMHVIDITEQPRPKLVSYKYSCPGDSIITQYGVCLFDINSKKRIDIDLSKWKDQYVEYAFDNTKKGDELFFFRTKRTWDEKELCRYNLSTGEVTVLLNEIDKPFFDYVIAQTHFLHGGKEFVFRSERTGYGHFYLYNGKDGEFKRPVTQGPYVTGQIVKIDTAKRDVYYYGFGKENSIDPYYYVLYKTNLDKAECKILTPENGNHKVYISPSSKYIIDSYSRVDLPNVNVVRDKNGKVIMELDKPDLDAVYAIGWKAPERFKVKAADGITDLYGVMWKPMDFDSTKTYPVISEVYPGPQFEYVPTTFALKSGHATKLAQLGFIVIQVGHRGGTPIRGKVYHRHGYGKLRDYPLADDKAAISQLALRYPFIDATKVGIFGHSGGGFMSTAALCTYPDFYSAAVSAAGNHDNRIYNTGWIEMNNGVEEIVRKKENCPNGDSTIVFKAKPIHTNMDLSKNYQGHVLLVTGMMDKNVNPAHTLRMAKALMDSGKNFDMICLPKSTHGFSGNEDRFFERKLWYHFAKYLLDDYSCVKHSNIEKCE